MKPKVNIINHGLVPKHVVLTNQEKNDVMKMYGIKKLNQFPKILKSDPAVKTLKAKPGDLVKIIRKSHIAKESIYYRLVIEG
jgi:DNA-directed RNA polymerase subunit H (RpoH/RPB5)